MAHDRPTAAELVEAVREFLEHDVQPALDGRVAFHARVAVNVLGMVQRELQESAATRAAERDGLVAILGLPDDDTSDVPALDARLAAAIRDGSLDDRRGEVLAHVRRSVAAKLAVAHPGYTDETP